MTENSTSVEPGDRPVARSSSRADPEARRPFDVRDPRIALWVFVAYLVIAFFVLLRVGSYRWFLGDEWDFIAQRSATDLHDLFRPHNQHWVTIPLLIWRGLYAAFGVRVYWPYQALLILLHLALAGVLRLIMRRIGVGPWVATIVASSFVLFGPGQENMLWAFQITFTGTLVLGLTQLVLSDHDGPIDRRDWLGLLAGLAALMSSGLAPALILATGVAVLGRRGWRQAAFHTVPLGALFVAWYYLADASLRSLLTTYGVSELPPITASAYVHWLKTAGVGLFTALGHFPIIAAALAALLVVGLAIAWKPLNWSTFRRRAGVPGALLIAAVVASSAAAPSRWFFGTDPAAGGRYMHVLAALTLPALAVAADAVIRRWNRSAPLVLALFLVPIPWNIAEFRQVPPFNEIYFDNSRNFVATLPTDPDTAKVAPWVQPDPSFFGLPLMTTGWLSEAAADGKLPPPGELNAITRSKLPVQLGVAQTPGAAPDGLACENHDTAIGLQPQQGDVWLIESPVQISTRKGLQPTSPAILYSPVELPDTPAVPLVVSIQLPGLELLVGPAPGRDSFTLCK